MLDRPAAEALRKFCAKGIYLKGRGPYGEHQHYVPPETIAPHMLMRAFFWLINGGGMVV